MDYCQCTIYISGLAVGTQGASAALRELATRLINLTLWLISLPQAERLPWRATLVTSLRWLAVLQCINTGGDTAESTSREHWYSETVYWDKDSTVVKGAVFVSTTALCWIESELRLVIGPVLLIGNGETCLAQEAGPCAFSAGGAEF